MRNNLVSRIALINADLNLLIQSGKRVICRISSDCKVGECLSLMTTPGIDAPTLSSLLIHSPTITSVVTPDSTIKILESTAAAIRCAEYYAD